MATIKIVIRTDDINQQGKVNIKIRITHNRKTTYFPTSYYVEPKYFDSKQGKIKSTYQNSNFLNIELQKIVIDFEQKLIILGNKINNLHVKQLLSMITNTNKDIDFFFVLNEFISKQSNKKTIETYKLTQSKLHEFCKLNVLNFSEINYKFLSSFETFLASKKLMVNSISIHLRNIRAVFNFAINFDYVGIELYPFRKFKIKHEKTLKRNLSLSELKKIYSAKITDKKIEFARDFFMISFYLIGMNPIDLYYAKQIDDNRIIYKRAKTGKIYSIKIEPELKLLIEKYKGVDSIFCFQQMYSDMNNLKKLVNKKLKVLMKNLSIEKDVTTYYARHSWATIAHQIGISKSDIALALGHGAYTVTDIYIDTDLSIIDRANRKVLDALL